MRTVQREVMIFNRARLFHEMVETGIQGTLPNARQPWQLPEQDIGKGLFAFGIMPNHHRKRRQERWKTSSMRRSAFSGSKTGRLAWHILMNERQTLAQTAGQNDSRRIGRKSMQSKTGTTRTIETSQRTNVRFQSDGGFMQCTMRSC